MARALILPMCGICYELGTFGVALGCGAGGPPHALGCGAGDCITASLKKAVEEEKTALASAWVTVAVAGRGGAEGGRGRGAAAGAAPSAPSYCMSMSGDGERGGDGAREGCLERGGGRAG